MQSWPVPVICWSSSSISLTRKEFSSLILLFSRTERPWRRAHITNSFLIYLLFLNNLSLLALNCCFSLPRRAFISEFDLCWDITESVWGTWKVLSLLSRWGGRVGKHSLKLHMDVVRSWGLWAVTAVLRSPGESGQRIALPVWNGWAFHLLLSWHFQQV